jgi:general secretion pathway protein N
MSSRAIPKPALLAGVVALCVLIGLASQRQSEPERATLAAQTQGIKPAMSQTEDRAHRDLDERGNTLWSIPLVALTTTRERPIFISKRRARLTAVKSSTLQTSPSAQPPFTLVGAIAGETDGIGIFQDGTTKGVIRLKPGESYAGWVLQTLKPREAILRNEQRNAVLAIPNPTLK